MEEQEIKIVEEKEIKETKKEALTKFTFYKPFYDVVEKEADEFTANIIMTICREMFNDGDVESELNAEEKIVWYAIKEIVLASKQKEMEGKKLDKYKNIWKSFTFYKSFYDTMKLLSIEEAGKYIKAVMTKAFTNRDAKDLNGKLNTYYNLAKISLDLSKKRSAYGKKGGEQKKEKLSTTPIKTEIVKKEVVDEVKKVMTMEEFLKLNPQIQNNLLYAKQQEKAKSINWKKLNECIKSNDNYKDVKELYILVNNYDEIVANS